MHSGVHYGNFQKKLFRHTIMLVAKPTNQNRVYKRVNLLKS